MNINSTDNKECRKELVKISAITFLFIQKLHLDLCYTQTLSKLSVKK